MALSTGVRLGPYEIVSHAGSGGMGEVYKARDTRLDRTVAIKILPSDISADAERRARFEREAKAIAALSHPRICALYDVGVQDGATYLVMEHLAGETLAERLRKGPLPLASALDIAAQVADALAAAHRAGIVHRDLKPANVMLTKSGAKLLDFGLARTIPLGVTGDQTHMATEEPLTSTGTILGTLHYMAPEQVEGATADARTDVFAFGAVLYEMLTGKRAFDGGSSASVIGQILHAQPSWMPSVRSPISALIRATVERCLAKDPDARWQSIADVAATLQLAAGPDDRPTHDTRPIVRRSAFVAAAAALMLAAAVLWPWVRQRTTPRIPPMELSVVPPVGTTLPDLRSNLTVNYIGSEAISPDGSKLAFVAFSAKGDPELWVRDLSSGNAIVVADTSTLQKPFWSPDSRSLAYSAVDGMYRLDLGQGRPRRITTPGGRGTWSVNGTIIFDKFGIDTLLRVDARGGVATPITRLERNGLSHETAHFLPDGNHFLYTAFIRGAGPRIVLGSLDGSLAQTVVERAENPIYSAGHLLFLRSSTLMAQPFDPVRFTTSGEPRTIASNVLSMGGGLSTSNTGVVAYRPRPSELHQAWWFDTRGQRLARVGVAQPYQDQFVSLSPDNKRLVYGAYASDVSRETDIWMLDLEYDSVARITSDPGDEIFPAWAPDGRSIAYVSDRDHVTTIWRRDLESGTQEVLRKVNDYKIYTYQWSPDGRFVIFHEPVPNSGKFLLSSVSVTQPGPPRRVTTSQLRMQAYATVSPDSRWTAYLAEEGIEGLALYLEPFPPTGQIQRIAPKATFVQWGRNAAELFFSADRKMYRVRPVASAAAEAPQFLFEVDFELNTFNVAKDADRFLLLVPLEGVQSGRINLITDWPERLSGAQQAHP